jgi:hypothetical protein
LAAEIVDSESHAICDVGVKVGAGNKVQVAAAGRSCRDGHVSVVSVADCCFSTRESLLPVASVIIIPCFARAVLLPSLLLVRP